MLSLCLLSMYVCVGIDRSLHRLDEQRLPDFEGSIAERERAATPAIRFRVWRRYIHIHTHTFILPLPLQMVTIIVFCAPLGVVSKGNTSSGFIPAGQGLFIDVTRVKDGNGSASKVKVQCLSMELAADIVQDIVRFFKISELEVSRRWWEMGLYIYTVCIYVCIYVIVGSRLSWGAGTVWGSAEDRSGLQCEQTAVSDSEASITMCVCMYCPCVSVLYYIVHI